MLHPDRLTEAAFGVVAKHANAISESTDMVIAASALCSTATTSTAQEPATHAGATAYAYMANSRMARMPT